jgi:alpha-methylacyl-CoA racemase
MAGHDINYIAIAGVLSLIKRKGEPPVHPVNLMGDFAGGGMLCAMGILLALMEREKSGQGQVIDAAMIDGASYLSTMCYGLLAHGFMTLNIGTNMLDGGAHFYQTYETADGGYMAVGAIEGRFYEKLVQGLGLDPSAIPEQNDASTWVEMKSRFAEIFKTKTRDQWTDIFKGSDACVTPVLGIDEVSGHPHNRERDALVPVAGFEQPAPAPRLSRTPGEAGSCDTERGAHGREILMELGYQAEDVERMKEKEIVEIDEV